MVSYFDIFHMYDRMFPLDDYDYEFFYYHGVDPRSPLEVQITEYIVRKIMQDELALNTSAYDCKYDYNPVLVEYADSRLFTDEVDYIRRLLLRTVGMMSATHMVTNVKVASPGLLWVYWS